MNASVYKDGILRNSYTPSVAGLAFAHKEPGQALDLHMDFRAIIREITMNPGMQEPPPPSFLLSSARTFYIRHTSARFALLRLWSASHFYPLLIGPENGDRMAFYDAQGRAWEWRFIPKDMPFSEWSVHQQLRTRIQPFRKALGDKVVVMRDMLLVMGNDEEELLTVAAATTYAVTTDPWRLEIDLWRSFVNVDMKFLGNLPGHWWE